MKAHSTSTMIVRFLATTVMLASVDSRNVLRVRGGNPQQEDLQVASGEEVYESISDLDYSRFENRRHPHALRFQRHLAYEEDDDLDYDMTDDSGKKGSEDCEPGFTCDDSSGDGGKGGKGGKGGGKKGDDCEPGYTCDDTGGKKGGKGGKGGGKKGDDCLPGWTCDDTGGKKGGKGGKGGSKKGSMHSKEGGRCEPGFTCDDNGVGKKGSSSAKKSSEKREDAGNRPDKGFDLHDCADYSNKWLAELAYSCDAASDFSNCECPSAYALLDSGMLRCAGTLQDDPRYVCPDDCEVCQLCMVVEGCPDIYDIHPNE